MSNWRKPGPRVQKSVRFTASETNREQVERGSWRKLPSVQESIFAPSPKALEGKAIVKFETSKLLFVRLPNARRSELESRRARLVSSEQLASWWKELAPPNQACIIPAEGNSRAELESNFCEAIAEISQRRGSRAVTDILAPLVVSVVSSWEMSGEIANVDDTNKASTTAAKGKKAGNALGNARSGSYREYERRMRHYQGLRERDLELIMIDRASRFLSSSMTIHGTDIQEFKLSFISLIRGPEQYEQEVLGVGLSTQTSVAREFAAEQALANWHICEEVYQTFLKPHELIMNLTKPHRKRDRTRGGRPQGPEGTSQ